MKIDSSSTLPAIAPIEFLAIPAALDGHTGLNRNLSGRAQIAAKNDIEAIAAWLDRYAATKTTFESYRKEAERLLLWSTLQLGKPVSSLAHEDLLAYERFLADPQPAARWVLPGKQKLKRDHPGWRPFAGPLAPTSQRQAMVILNAMFSWLVSAGYLMGNPLSLSRQRARKSSPKVARYLPPSVWQEVKASVEGMPRETARHREHYSRDRWILSLLFLGGLRISELAENTMGVFYARRDRESKERWWMSVTGKGNKVREVPATDELMVELTRYRKTYELSPLPVTGDGTPLVLPIGGKVRALTRMALHDVVKSIFAEAAQHVRRRGPEHEAVASLLEQASAHWLRHTSGSSMADGELDLRFLRDNLGHESLTTSSIYLHSEDDERHKQTEKALRISWM
ncbi:MAG: tyrosine-type recombinase/integrase [Betaproteobacteria bacterium]|nr:tyrosine-type recombinase/integrase [Betaproteobacteria bacterium]